MATEYKLVKQECRITGATEVALPRAEAELNRLAAYGWRVVACVMTYQTVLVWTLERPTTAQQEGQT